MSVKRYLSRRRHYLRFLPLFLPESLRPATTTSGVSLGWVWWPVEQQLGPVVPPETPADLLASFSGQLSLNVLKLLLNVRLLFLLSHSRDHGPFQL